MKYRNLRVVWSVVWGLAAILLIMVWAQSYGGKANSPSQFIEIGDVTLWATQGMLRTERIAMVNHAERMDGLGIHNAYWSRSSRTSQTPLWCLFPFLAMMPWASWISWSTRFSLRTLLITTTLVAVVLGLIVAVMR